MPDQRERQGLDFMTRLQAVRERLNATTPLGVESPTLAGQGDRAIQNLEDLRRFVSGRLPSLSTADEPEVLPRQRPCVTVEEICRNYGVSEQTHTIEQREQRLRRIAEAVRQERVTRSSSLPRSASTISEPVSEIISEPVSEPVESVLLSTNLQENPTNDNPFSSLLCQVNNRKTVGWVASWRRTFQQFALGGIACGAVILGMEYVDAQVAHQVGTLGLSFLSAGFVSFLMTGILWAFSRKAASPRAVAIK